MNPIAMESNTTLAIPDESSLSAQVSPSSTVLENDRSESTAVDIMDSISPSSASSSIGAETLAESLTFSWHDVRFSVNETKKNAQGKKETAEKIILGGMNTGIVKSGQIVAIMGGSGAGKSSMLNCLSGRVGAGKLKGRVLFNDELRKRSTWKTICSFVEQDDVMNENLTVLETLRYTARLRLASSMTLTERYARVDQVMLDLGLEKCRNAKIGGPFNKGISGGERKRVGIAIEMLTHPRLLFLDEPTSGLDSFTAYNIIESVKQLAINHNCAVILTIHQPRADILELFDKLLLLSMGKTIFFGSLKEAIPHFESVGYPIPESTNPSDHFSDVTTMDFRSAEVLEESKVRIRKFVAAWEQSKMYRDMEVETSKLSLSTHTLATNSSSIDVWLCSWWTEFTILVERKFKNMTKDKTRFLAIYGNALAIFV